MTKSNSFSTRFNDTPLSFGMRLYETPNKKRTLWRFEVTRYCGSYPPLIEVDADHKTLLEMKSFIEQALKAVQETQLPEDEAA